MRNTILFCRASLLGLLLAGALLGQNANVTGQIVDSQGGRMPSATITLTELGTGRALTTQTNRRATSSCLRSLRANTN